MDLRCPILISLTGVLGNWQWGNKLIDFLTDITPQTFPIYLKRLVSIKHRGNKVILGETSLYHGDANVLSDLLRNPHLCHTFKMQNLKRWLSNLETDLLRVNRNSNCVSVNIWPSRQVSLICSIFQKPNFNPTNFYKLMGFTFLYLTQGWNCEMRTMRSLFASVFACLCLWITLLRLTCGWFHQWA